VNGLAVAIHDVEPATFERAALLRDWLADLGVDRATLLVIPARDLHPFATRRPELADWLLQRRQAGDAVAQHGLRHGPEFAGMDEAEARSAVESGRRLLRLAGVEPRGFVAPGYAYTPALERALAGRFEWWAGLLGLQRGGGRRTLAPALALGRRTALRRAATPGLVRALARLGGPLLRLDLHPADLDHPRHVFALEAVLRGARGRTAVTYDEVAGVVSARAASA
jgi:predicted deacetylase